MTAVLRIDVVKGAKPTRLSAGIDAVATTLNVTPGSLPSWTPVVYGRIPVILNQGESNEEHVYAAAVAGDTLTGCTRGADGTVAQPHDPNEPVWVGLFAEHVDQAIEFLSLPTAADQVAVSTGADAWAAGTAKQISTHASPDTDAATGSLHHTIGTGATQAAPGTHPGATSGTHGVTGDIVGTGGAQTLTGPKTLTAPIIGDFTNAGHDHLDADDGGLLTQAATHQSPDTNASVNALHHTLGTGPNQASPGDHEHAVTTPDLPDTTPRGWRGSTDVFTNQSSSGSVSSPCLTLAVEVEENRRYEILTSARLETTVANDSAGLVLQAAGLTHGTITLDEDEVQLRGTAGAGAVTKRIVTVYTPPGTGTVTFTTRVVRHAGSGTVSANEGNGHPYLTVVDIGGATPFEPL